jgi:hypothetical protein
LRCTTEGRGKIETGFERAVDGWHITKIDEGIAYLLGKKKDGESEAAISTNKQGDKNWKIALIVDDEDDESNGVKIDVIVAENKRGEQTITDFLGATGLFAAFQKNFPGDVSVFDSKVMDKLKGKLPGQLMRVKTKQNIYKDKQGQDQTAVNLVGFGKMSDSIEQLEKDLFPEKKGAAKGGKKETAETKKVEPDEEF